MVPGFLSQHSAVQVTAVAEIPALGVQEGPLSSMELGPFVTPQGQVKVPPDILLWRIHHASCCDGRAVKALDLKSNGVSPRRFKSCSQRELLLTAPVLLSTGGDRWM